MDMVTRSIKSTLGLGPLALLAGCLFGSPPTTPSALAGDVPLTVVNASNRTIDAMFMFPDDAALDPTNWFGHGPRALRLDAGQQHVFSVKPGAYRVGFELTDIYGQSDGRWGATNGAKGTQGAGPAIEIHGPTYIVVGTNPVTAPSGVATVTLPVVDRYGPATANCKADGLAAGGPEECCSRLLDQHGMCAVSID